MAWFSERTDILLFHCPCGRVECDAPPPSPLLVNMLEAARASYGSPIVVTSGPTCAFHNDQPKAQGGRGGIHDSTHERGEGVDLACEDSGARWALVEALKRAGFRRIGVYTRHVHADASTTDVQDVLWVGVD